MVSLTTSASGASVSCSDPLPIDVVVLGGTCRHDFYVEQCNSASEISHGSILRCFKSLTLASIRTMFGTVHSGHS